MRELKFRRYDDYEFVFFDLVDFRKYDEIPFVVQKSPIEQYTGLKDKNGKEIYEGDIILVSNHGRTPFVVIFREFDCSFIANNKAMVDYVYMFKYMPQCYEVIGNIHENHELLEAKNGD